MNKLSILQILYNHKIEGRNGCALKVQDDEKEMFNRISKELLRDGYIIEIKSLYPQHRAFTITDIGIGAVWFGFEEAGKILTMA